MAVAAAAVARPLVITAVAPFEMAAESGGATHLDRGHDASLGRRERPIVLLTIGFAVAAEDVRHFHFGRSTGVGAQREWGDAGFTSIETGRGSKSRGLEVASSTTIWTCNKISWKPLWTARNFANSPSPRFFPTADASLV